MNCDVTGRFISYRHVAVFDLPPLVLTRYCYNYDSPLRTEKKIVAPERLLFHYL